MVHAVPDPIDPFVLDRFTALAAQVLGVPAVGVSLLDEHRRRVVSSHNLSVRAVKDGGMARGTGRSGQLAVHTAIRLVASDGRQVGTLTVMDWRARRWSASQVEFLKELSVRIVGEVDIGPVERMM